MTPSELMALADDIEKGQLGYRRKATAALRSYAELLSALGHLDEVRASVYPPIGLKFAPSVEGIKTAAECLGWPGLEEA